MEFEHGSEEDKNRIELLRKEISGHQKRAEKYREKGWKPHVIGMERAIERLEEELSYYLRA